MKNEEWIYTNQMTDLGEKEGQGTDSPTIVCLCGSTRFSEAFQKANLEETLAGRIVLTIGCDMKSDDALGLGPDTKAMLDELHLRKIDLADEVLILNVGGYIGESTQSELEYSKAIGKRIRYLEEPACTCPTCLEAQEAWWHSETEEELREAHWYDASTD